MSSHPSETIRFLEIHRDANTVIAALHRQAMNELTRRRASQLITSITNEHAAAGTIAELVTSLGSIATETMFAWSRQVEMSPDDAVQLLLDRHLAAQQKAAGA